MFPDTLEIHRLGRVFEVEARPFYPIGADDPDLLKYRPIVYELLDTERVHVVTLPSQFESDAAIQDGFEYVKKELV